MLENLSMSICGGNSCVCIWLTKEFGWKEETGIVLDKLVPVNVTLSWLPISFLSIQIWGLSQYIPTMLEKNMVEHVWTYFALSGLITMKIYDYHIFSSTRILPIALPTLAVGHGQLVMPETDRSDMDKVWEGRIWNQTCHLNLQHCIPTSSSIIGRFFYVSNVWPKWFTQPETSTVQWDKEPIWGTFWRLGVLQSSRSLTFAVSNRMV